MPDVTSSPESPELPEWRQQRRDRIVRAALELLEDADYDRIQIRDVAARSGFALGTIYRYFKSKEHVYAAVMAEWAASFEQNLERQPLRGDPPERLKQVIRRIIRAFARRPQFLRLERVLENSVDEHAVAEFARVASRNLSGFREALVGIPDDVASDIVVVVSNVLATQLNQYALGNRTVEEVERFATRTVDLIFSPPPVAAPDGRRRGPLRAAR